MIDGHSDKILNDYKHVMTSLRVPKFNITDERSEEYNNSSSSSASSSSEWHKDVSKKVENLNRKDIYRQLMFKLNYWEMSSVLKVLVELV